MPASGHRDGHGRWLAARKPWMANRPGETDAERADRLEHTCYACGWECDVPAVLDLHQETCTGPTGD